MTKLCAIAMQVRVLHELETKVDDVILVLLLLHEPHLSVFDSQLAVLAVLLQDQVSIVIVKLLSRFEVSISVKVR